MPRIWKTITLPEETIDEVKKNMDGYTSISEFVRSAIRFYIDFLQTRKEGELSKVEVA